MKLFLFDIGSNSIRTAKLEQVGGGRPRVFEKRVFTTRLGEGLAGSGLLDPARAQQSLLVIRTLSSEAALLGYACYAYATSAVRDAQNGAAFVREIEAILGEGRVRVLSGAEEAAFTQSGADPGGTRVVVDIGGGSTQIARGTHRESWPIGCVRARDMAPYDDIYRIIEILRPRLRNLFALPDDRYAELPGAPDAKDPARFPIGVGGTITTLALLAEGHTAFVGDWAGEKELMYIELLSLLRDLNAIGDAKRASIPLLKNRHDVILHGGVILAYVMEYLHVVSIYASLNDGLDGYALHLCRTLAEP